MIEYTQTKFGEVKGNCFQTALGCILEVDPEGLPAQDIWDVRKGKGWACSYHNIIQGYLWKHHGLGYCELADWEFAAVSVREPGWHVLIGPTVRTSDAHQVNHAVVGRYGETVWDPHPSRAGLVAVEKWGLVYQVPPRIRASRDQYEPGSEGWRVFIDCLCASCGAARGDTFEDLLEP
jgi:hypothetical protein